jgi:copper(I)-binding protein
MRTPDRVAPRFVLIVAALLLAAGATAAPAVTASDAWIRLLPGNVPLAGYLSLHNHTNKPLKLVGAKSPAFKRIEMHHSMTMNGMEKMQPVKAVTIPAHGVFTFAPGGYHLMLWRRREHALGKHADMKLKLSNGNTFKVEFTVKEPGE